MLTILLPTLLSPATVFALFGALTVAKICGGVCWLVGLHIKRSADVRRADTIERIANAATTTAERETLLISMVALEAARRGQSAEAVRMLDMLRRSREITALPAPQEHDATPLYAAGPAATGTSVRRARHTRRPGSGRARPTA